MSAILSGSVGLILAISLSSLPAFAQEENPKPLEVTISPTVKNPDVIPTFDQIYIDVGEDRLLTFGEWLSRSFGPKDELGEEALSGKYYRSIPDLADTIFDQDRIVEGSYGSVLGSKFSGRNFIDIAASFGHDPTANKPGAPVARGIYAAPSTNPLTPADVEFGEIDFTGAKRLREFIPTP